MTELEFWFLDVVVVFPCALCRLGSPEVAEDLNRRSHGLSHEDLVAALGDLCQRGLIYFAMKEGEPIESTPALLRTEVRLPKLPRGPRLSYYLTAAGGDAWESATQPDWSRFIYGPWTTIDGEFEGIAMDRARIEQKARTSYHPLAMEETRVVTETWDLVEP